MSVACGGALRLQRQRGFSHGAVVNQFDRMDALGRAAVLEVNQSGLGKGPVAFRECGLLNALCHRALYLYGDLDRWGRLVGVALVATSAAGQAALALRFGWLGRRPLGIF